MSKALPASKKEIANGTILRNAWGWEQTTVDFYEVVASSASFVTVRKLKKIECSDGPQTMTAKVQPAIGQYAGEATKRLKKHELHGRMLFKLDYGHAEVWSGKPQQESSYA
jgi:hypothetical protein